MKHKNNLANCSLNLCISVLIVFSLILFISPATVYAQQCGDDVCSISENTFSCTQDCGDRAVIKGNISEVKAVGKNGGRLKYVDSQETTGENGYAVLAFDGNPKTCWHTEWATYPGTARDAQYPHHLTIDMGAVSKISGFKYLPR
ncbi:discoidin domain-containing protein [Candidatus Omnitrophota bacterium]